MRAPRTDFTGWTTEQIREHKNLGERRRRSLNPEKDRARTRRYYAAHSTETLARHAVRFKENPEPRRATVRRSRYKAWSGETLEDKATRLASQGGRCGICKTTDPGAKGWVTDHDHSKKKGDFGFIRGILCGECNIGGGKFKDDPALLRAAADWFSR
jgi:hypothetical protein